MKLRWALFSIFSSALCWSQQAQAPAPVPAAPASTPAEHFATVIATMEAPLTSKTCKTGKEFRAAIVSPFEFTGTEIRSGARLAGHIRACNRDQDDKLALAVLVVDSLMLPDSKSVPIGVVLQALGPPIPVAPIITGVKDSAGAGMGTLSDGEEIALRGPTTVGLLDGKSNGVVRLKHVEFENVVSNGVAAWVLKGNNAPLDLSSGSQLVVRFRIAPLPPQASK